MQNVFWTSTASRQSRKESSAAGPSPCSSAPPGASRARSSYGTRQTSPTRLGSKWAGSGSSCILGPESVMQRRRERDPDNRAFFRLKPSHRLAPRLLAPVVQQGESSLAQLLGGGLNRVRVAHLELQAHLRDGPIRRPVRCAEARLRGLRQRPHPEVLAALDPLAVEVVAAGTRLEREAQRIDEQFAAPLRIWRDHRDAGDELNIHA